MRTVTKEFAGGIAQCLRYSFEEAPHDAGYQLNKVQRGEQPDFKPMGSSGKGIEEIRVMDDSGAHPL